MNVSKEILAFAMNMERQGQAFYERFLDQVEHPDAKEWFRVLAQTEKEHYAILEKQYNQITGEGTWTPLDELKLPDEMNLFHDRQKKENVDPANSSYSLSDLAVLRMAYLIENDFAEFYKKAMERVEDPAGKKMLETLHHWEDDHRRLFHDAYRAAMESNWFQQGFAPF